MTDAEYRIQRKRLKALQNKWHGTLGLHWWYVTYSYAREPLKSEVAEGRTCLAQTMVDWEYLKATITFDMQAIAGEKDDDLEVAFVHECIHIFVNEMRQWAESEIPSGKMDEAMKHEERVVTQLTNAVIWSRRAGLDDGKKSLRLRCKPKRRK
jgi:hypothetical protein